jgi:hypothetical protein
MKKGQTVGKLSGDAKNEPRVPKEKRLLEERSQRKMNQSRTNIPMPYSSPLIFLLAAVQDALHKRTHHSTEILYQS